MMTNVHLKIYKLINLKDLKVYESCKAPIECMYGSNKFGNNAPPSLMQEFVKYLKLGKKIQTHFSQKLHFKDFKNFKF